MTRKSAKKAATSKAAEGALIPPSGGAVVRMYRIGHGDCFLLAFPGEERIVHVLVDCGYKPGSPGKIEPPTNPADIAASILVTTGGNLDVAVLTHEHQDHVNGITEEAFPSIKIGQTWQAWTDDPQDELAEKLREIYRDKLEMLLVAQRRLHAAEDSKRSARIADYLAFELGGSEENYDTGTAEDLMSADSARWTNKRSIKYFKDHAATNRYLRPGNRFLLPGATDVTVYVLGPPRDINQLKSLDPKGSERFGDTDRALASVANFFADALAETTAQFGGRAPFARKYVLDWNEAMADSEFGSFFSRHYGNGPDVPPDTEAKTVKDNAIWRRIDMDWLYTAEQLAIDMNDQTNNSSLVLAFELGQRGKVLLFAADAQAGNWRSWADCRWTNEDKSLFDTRDLLARAVLYKVGHHGSHNATLNGDSSSPLPSLGWIASGDNAGEFTAMITAVPAWAQTQKGWNHPMPAIKDALLSKAAGRVLQTDTPVKAMRTSGKLEPDFNGRLTGTDLYFDLEIRP